MKKLLALFLALLLALSMGAVAFADDPVDPKAAAQDYPELKNETPVMEHTYVAYQIFTGTLGPDGQLGDIRWGDGINVGSCSDFESLLGRLFRDVTFGQGEENLFYPIENLEFGPDATQEEKEAAALKIVLEIMEGWGDNSDYAEAFAKDAYDSLKGDGVVVTENTTVASGYYLIKDTYRDADGEYVKNLSILQTADAEGHLRIIPKIDMPVLVKKVKDKDDSSGVETDWQDSADYDIGDEIPYKITAKLGRISDYDKYFFGITDTLSQGLSYKDGSAVIKFDGVDVTSQDLMKESKGTSSVTWQNTSIIPGENGFHDYMEITIEFICILNEKATIGAKGNPNRAFAEFYNNPNQVTDQSRGTTPYDYAYVFTYETDINKVDENEKPLAGAEFTLLKKIAPTDEYKTVAANVEAAAVQENGETVSYTAQFKGLDDGYYRLIETKTPAGYNTISPMDIHITAEHQTLADDPKLIKLTTDKGTVVFDEGRIDISVVNQSGSVLPETGGIGTTIFYVVGAVLVVGAAVILFAKKKVEE